MILLQFVFGALFAAGLFLAVADALGFPGFAARKAMMQAGRRGEKGKWRQALLTRYALRLSGRIRLDPYKKSRIEKTLMAAGISMTPEVYTAHALIKSALVMFFIIPAFLIMPLLAPVLLFLAILIYFREIRSADEKLAEKKERIEQELPRFAASITQELKASRDVLAMIEHYKRSCGKVFASELDVLTADMRSSSYEAALLRFEARMNSAMLQDVVRGLVGVLRGDESGIYFQMLSHDMKQMELQRLKAKAMKVPGKIRVFSFVMLMCFLLTYLAVIAYEVVHSLGGMF